jgi:hypothetical protein
MVTPEIKAAVVRVRRSRLMLCLACSMAPEKFRSRSRRFLSNPWNLGSDYQVPELPGGLKWLPLQDCFPTLRAPMCPSPR